MTCTEHFLDGAIPSKSYCRSTGSKEKEKDVREIWGLDVKYFLSFTFTFDIRPQSNWFSSDYFDFLFLWLQILVTSSTSDLCHPSLIFDSKQCLGCLSPPIYLVELRSYGSHSVAIFFFFNRGLNRLNWSYFSMGSEETNNSNVQVSLKFR
jgi:hypothetical protein